MWGHSEVVKLLLAANAKVDRGSESGLTPLMSAVQYGHLEAVKLLLDANAEINIKDNNGETAITLATKNHFLEIKGLLEQEASRRNSIPEGRSISEQYVSGSFR